MRHTIALKIHINRPFLSRTKTRSEQQHEHVPAKVQCFLETLSVVVYDMTKLCTRVLEQAFSKRKMKKVKNDNKMLLWRMQAKKEPFDYIFASRQNAGQTKL